QEPLVALQDDATRQVDPATLDLVVVPGVAFDRSGRRLGHGFGFYDRLLARVAEATKLTAIAFECQMFDILPHEPHDVTVDVVVTESNVYRR
ncbi:MAG: 5-formyltetrahydrofolate cyclo-ligase, partial [Pirellulales bacterium]